MKKIILILFACLIIVGCKKEQYIDESENLSVYCDKEYGVEYIRDNGYNRGGITVRLDENGNVIHCK